MVSRNAQTDLAIDFEASGRSEEAEGWRAQRVLRRQHDAAVVEAGCVGRGCGRAAQSKVPFEEVVFEGFGVVVCRGGRGELGSFFYCRGVSGVRDGWSIGGGAYGCA